MKILFLTSAHNSMSQRAYVELVERNHDVSIELALSAEVMLEAAEMFQPDLIVAPMLKKAIPDAVWRRWPCLIIHPGIMGDRGPSSLDWAILNNEAEWGVTLLQANAEMDAGDIWATATFPMRQASKSSLYKNEVIEAAMRALLLAVERFGKGDYRPEPLDYSRPDVRGRLLPTMKQEHRAVDWSAPTAEVARRIRSGDGSPGVLHTLLGEPFFLFGAHEEDALRGEPGQILAQRDGAICVATGDGALWITHLKRKVDKDAATPAIKLPAAVALAGRIDNVPEVPLAPEARPAGRTWQEIRYVEEGAVGHLHFDFYNGAMSTAQCERLRAAIVYAKARPTTVLVLWGGEDYFSNGIDLNAIQAAQSPADESWANINAINDVVLEIAQTEGQMVIAALQGNAGAGGVVLPLAADVVYGRAGIVLNPHYKGMGGLYGSEYWTYLLPKRVGGQAARSLTEGLQPLGAREARRIGLLDDAFGANLPSFRAEVCARAAQLAARPDLRQMLALKRRKRAVDEARKPMAAYRAEELAHMWQNFYGPDESYHRARERFVWKVAATETPAHIARHRGEPAAAGVAPTPIAPTPKAPAHRAAQSEQMQPLG